MQWDSWRRTADYYDEGELTWLWADSIIRTQSEGKKTLDDFCHIFHGAPSTAPEVKTYTFDDVVNALNQVVPYDWRGVLDGAADRPRAGSAARRHRGQRVEADLRRAHGRTMMKAWEDDHSEINASFSIGVIVKEDGEIEDTIEGMDAARAGIGPAMKIVAVNGRRFTPQVFRDALAAGKNSSQPLQLIVENTDYFRTFNLDYHGGEKYPHLVRDESKPDLLTDIIRPADVGAVRGMNAGVLVRSQVRYHLTGCASSSLHALAGPSCHVDAANR